MSRKYRPPYTRRPDPVTTEADALWEEARRQDRLREAEANDRALTEALTPPDEEYDWGGAL